ncbi:MAG: hypothetical protein IH991_23070, partial [Planctomycetes bacterium]|nr:hypothetical protein [Planctomycetota bacterium]
EFYVGFAQANNGIEQRKPLSQAIKTNDQVTTITGNPDGMFTKRLMEWLLGIICGVLCVEWIIRRLSRLA